MRAATQCTPCIVDDLCGALELLDLEQPVRTEVLRRAFAYLGEQFSPEEPPSTFITGVHRILKEVTGITCPFAELRQRCNQAGLRLARRVEEEAAQLDGRNRFRFLVRWAIAGNHLDFRTVGAGYEIGDEEMAADVRRSYEEGLWVDDTEEIHRLAARVGSILFIHDNVGEIALDGLLISELHGRCGEGSSGSTAGTEVTSALRAGPITSDATMEDGLEVGLDKVAHRLILAGPDTLGLSWEEMDPQCRQALEQSDLVVAKGQANYYVLSEHRGEIEAAVACLLRTKCSPVSRRFNAEDPVNLAVLI